MANIYVNTGVTSNNVTLNAQDMFVSNGGTANATTVNDGSFLFVSALGTVNDTVVNSGGEVDLDSKGKANNTTINEGGYLEAYGIAIGTVVGKNGGLVVSSGGTASNTTVNNGGYFTLVEGGLKGSTTVEQGGTATFIDAGATGVQIDVHGGKLIVKADTAPPANIEGAVTVDSGGSLAVSSGGIVSGVTLENASVTVFKDGELSNTKVTSATVEVRAGASASGATLNSDGILKVSSGGFIQGIKVNDGGVVTGVLRGASMMTFNGGTLNFNIADIAPGNECLVDDNSFTAIDPYDPSLIHLTLTVKASGQAKGTYNLIEGVSGFQYAISVINTLGKSPFALGVGQTKAFGDAKYTLTETGGNLAITVGGLENTFTGDLVDEKKVISAGSSAVSVKILNSGSLWIEHGGAADDIRVSFGGKFVVSGGTAETIMVSSGGRAWVWDGGETEDTWVYGSGRLIVSSGGTASNNYVSSSGAVLVSEGGLADGNHVFKSGGIFVSSGGKADHTVISSAGDLYVSSGGLADHTTVVEGGFLAGLHVFDGGRADNTSLASSGRMEIASGGKADRITLSSGGSLYVRSGATATNIDWTPGANVVAINSGATATFVSSFTGVYLGSDGKVIESAASMDGTVIDGHNMNVMEGGLATNATINSGRLWVYSGGTANNVTLNEWDVSLLVYSGGTVDSATVNSGFFELDGGTADHTVINFDAYLDVYGGVASRTTINSGGILAVSSGGTADAVTISSGGILFVDAGATVTNVDWTPCVGNINLDDGASVEFVTPHFGVYFASGGVPQFSALTMTGKLVGSDCRMDVLASGTATDTAIESGGIMIVSSGGIADNASVKVGGRLWVSSGAAATIRESGGYVSCHDSANVTFLENTFSDLVIEDWSLTVHSGTTAVNIEIKGGWAYVYSGGVISKATAANYDYNGGGVALCGGAADDVTVKSGGYLDVSSGGAADDVTVKSSGHLDVSSGGVANNIMLENGGNASVFYAGVIRNVTVSSGGCLYLYDSSTLTGSMTFEKDAFVSASFYQDGVDLDFDLTIHSPGATTLVNDLSAVQGQGVYYTLTVDGTEAEGTYRLADGAAGFDGSISVRNQDNPNLGDLHVGGSVSVNGICYSLTLNGASLTVTVEDQSAGNIFTGALADATKIIYAGSSAVDVGVYVDGRLLISGGEASNTSIYESGTMEVSGGGTASGTSVLYGGVFSVLDGGTAKTVEIDYGAEMTVGAGGTADEITAGGKLQVLAGGSATGVTAEADANLSFEVDSDTYVQGTSGGSAFEIKDGHVSGYTIVNGSLDILSGAAADGTTVQFGWMSVSEGGTVRDTAVATDGMLLIESGGKATGTLTIADGAVVSAETGGIIDFDISERAPGNDALVNNLSLVTGTPSYTLTVSDMQTAGTYTLANGATGFDKSITIVDSIGTEYGTLTVGGMAQAAFGIAYTLGLSSGGVLSVTAETVIGPDFSPPELSGITVSPTDPTNQNVTVMADFTDNVEVADKYFRIDDGDWEFYPDGGVVMTQNGTVYFKATDFSGNESSGDDCYEVTNIDKVKPTISKIKPNTTEPADSVTVTAKFADNVALASKLYRIGTSGDWNTYTTGVTVSENCTIYFKAVDKAGNETEAHYDVTNIQPVVPDTAPPTITNITPSTTELTNVNVLVTADFDDDVELTSKQYRIGTSGAWTDYVDGALVTENATVFFKAVDAAGNVTEEQYEVTNIDKVVPTVMNITHSPTGPAKSVTVTADFDDDVATKQYKIGSGVWTDYVDGVIMTENGTVYFWAVDTAGNESSTVSYTVENIDNIAPTISKIKPNTTEPADSVTVTAKFADNVALASKLYRIGTSGAWLNYVDGVTVTANGTVYFKAVDKAGNDATAQYEVTNIKDSTPVNGPEEPKNNTLYLDKTHVNTDVTEAYGTYLTEPGQEVFLDPIGTVDEGGYHNSVDRDDTIDYAKIVLEHGAKLSFHAEAAAAATFTVYSLTEKKGKYTLKKLQTLKLTDKDRDGVFTADSSKLLQLQESGPYYVSMQFTDKDKSKTAYYNVTLNGGDNGSMFYPLGNNSDDWTDMKTAGYSGSVGDLGVITDETLYPISGEWVGFGDKTDCKKFTLASAADLSLLVSAQDGPLKLTVCKLKETMSKKGEDITTYSQVTVKSVTVKAGQPKQLNSLRLAAGDYFFKVESTNVEKSTGYSVQVTSGDFYTDGDDGWNNVLLDGKTLNENEAYFYDNRLAGSGDVHFDKAGNDKSGDDYAVFTSDGNSYGGFVGFGDEIDFAKITLTQTSDVTFTLAATNDATLEIIQLTEKNGKYTKKSLQTVKYKTGGDAVSSKKPVTLEVKDGVSYCVSVKATNIKKTTVDPRTYYNVSYAVASKDVSALSMPETDSLADSLAMPDSLSFGQNGTADELAGTCLDPAADKLLGESGSGLLASL